MQMVKGVQRSKQLSKIGCDFYPFIIFSLYLSLFNFFLVLKE